MIDKAHQGALESAYKNGKLVLPKINEYKSKFPIISLSKDEIIITNLLFKESENNLKIK